MIERFTLKESPFGNIQIYDRLEELAIIQLNKNDTELADYLLNKITEFYDGEFTETISITTVNSILESYQNLFNQIPDRGENTTINMLLSSIGECLVNKKMREEIIADKNTDYSKKEVYKFE